MRIKSAFRVFKTWLFAITCVFAAAPAFSSLPVTYTMNPAIMWFTPPSGPHVDDACTYPFKAATPTSSAEGHSVFTVEQGISIFGNGVSLPQSAPYGSTGNTDFLCSFGVWQGEYNGVTIWNVNWESIMYSCPAHSHLDGAGASSCSCDLGYKENGKGSCSPVVDKITPATNNCPNLRGNPIDIATGAKIENISTGVSLGGMTLVARYDSTPKVPGGDYRVFVTDVNSVVPTFGPLWRTNFHRSLMVLDNGNQVTLDPGDGNYITFVSSPTGYVTTNPSKSKLTVSGSLASTTYLYVDGSTGQQEVYENHGRLVQITRANGFVMNFVYGGVNGNDLMSVNLADGRSIGFAYQTVNGVDRIASIKDVGGKTVVIAYDSNGNLTSFTWQDGKVFQLVYENQLLPWALTGKIDENGSRYATYTYGTFGTGATALTSAHASGVDAISVNFLTPGQEVIDESYDPVADVIYRYHRWVAPTNLSTTNAAGTVNIVGMSIINGNPYITSQSQPAGSGCAASSNQITYDQYGNKTSVIDFDGTQTCYAYDAQGEVTTLVEGGASTDTCATLLSASSLPAGMRKVTSFYHPVVALPVVQSNGLERLTTVFNGQSDPVAGGTVTCGGGANLPSGVAPILPCKVYKQALNGAASVTATRTSSVRYNASGQVLQTIDAAGAVTNYAYYNSGAVIAPANSGQTTATILLLNGENSVVDSGPIGLNVSSAGYTQNKTNVKDGAASLNAAGNSYILANSSQFSFGTGDFTAEGWFNFSSFNVSYGQAVLFDTRSTSNGGSGGILAVSPTAIELYNGSSWVTIAPNNLSLNTWYHLAFVRKAGTMSAFVNGASVGSAADATNHGSGQMTVGACSYTPIGACPFNGVLDDVVVSSGAKYSANFTPLAIPSPVPVAPVIINAEAGIVDAGANGVAITASGYSLVNASSGLVKNGAASLQATGGSYLYMQSPIFNMGAGDFTMEGWFKFSSFNVSAGVAVLFDTRKMSDGSSGGILGVTPSSIAWYGPGAGSPNTIAPNNLSLNTWYHIAFVRKAGMLTVFVNGVAAGSVANTTNHVSGQMTIGACSWSPIGACPFNGYMDDISISPGVAKYDGNFTPADLSTVALVNTWPGHSPMDLMTVTSPTGAVTTFNSYDPYGHVTQMTDPKGVVTNFVYTPRGFISSVTVAPPGKVATSTSYTYDSVGQVIGVTAADGTTTSFSYDAAHRLVGASDAVGNTVSYTLDASGNRVSESVNDPQGVLRRNITRSFDQLNRVQQIQLH